MHDIHRGLQFLRSKTVPHRDIRPVNVLADSKLNQVSLSDFGRLDLETSPQTKLSYDTSKSNSRISNLRRRIDGMEGEAKPEVVSRLLALGKRWLTIPSQETPLNSHSFGESSHIPGDGRAQPPRRLSRTSPSIIPRTASPVRSPGTISHSPHDSKRFVPPPAGTSQLMHFISGGYWKVASPLPIDQTAPAVHHLELSCGGTLMCPAGDLDTLYTKSQNFPMLTGDNDNPSEIKTCQHSPRTNHRTSMGIAHRPEEVDALEGSRRRECSGIGCRAWRNRNSSGDQAEGDAFVRAGRTSAAGSQDSEPSFGHPAWVAPEMIIGAGAPRSVPQDYWACGDLLLLLLPRSGDGKNIRDDESGPRGGMQVEGMQLSWHGRRRTRSIGFSHFQPTLDLQAEVSHIGVVPEREPNRDGALERGRELCGGRAPVVPPSRRVVESSDVDANIKAKIQGLSDEGDWKEKKAPGVIIADGDSRDR